MKRFFALIFALALALTACTQAEPAITTEAAPAADKVVQAILSVCGDMETEAVTGDDLAFWLTEFYGLRSGSWDDAALYRAADPMYAFEIAVIRLTMEADGAEVLSGLETYRYDRQGDFYGYDPEQAALVEHSLAVTSAGGSFAALLICGNPNAAADAFYAALNQEAAYTPAVTASPEPTPTPTPEPTPAPAPTPEPTPEPPSQPIEHMMDIYDTSAILAAWNSGDPTGLNSYDRAIYDRCAEVLGSILKDGMTDYEKEKAIYQWVVARVDYDYDHYDKLEGASLDSSTPYNPLINGKGICLGFATTFQLLADLAGLESIIVVGTAFGDEDHAWNMIRLNGEWYCLDATWDDNAGKPMFWSYFNVTSQHMTQTRHHWDTDAYPTATATDGGNP